MFLYADYLYDQEDPWNGLLRSGLLVSVRIYFSSSFRANSLKVSSTYDLRLASGCYSDKKGDNSERRRCKSDVEEDKSYRGGVQHLKKRKEDVGGEGVGFSLCAAPLDRLSPRISEERSYDGGVGVGVGVGVVRGGT